MYMSNDEDVAVCGVGNCPATEFRITQGRKECIYGHVVEVRSCGSSTLK